MRSKGEMLNKHLPKDTAWTIEVERGVQLAMEQYAIEYHKSKAENLPISDVVGRSEQLVCECKDEWINHIDNFSDRFECKKCGKRF